MINRRTFLKSASLLTIGGAVSQQLSASNRASANTFEYTAAPQAKKQMGLQTYSLGSDLLKDLPNGLARLAKMGYTELELFGYKEDTGEFGTYSKENSIFIKAKDYKKLAEDNGLKITSSHL
ncbi:MAG: sugar phosphate isomerase/epimerase, partial [Parabacteroides sp.]|nr:sugar phosphate isomerase/epimerase [Parabacteroides sp.]